MGIVLIHRVFHIRFNAFVYEIFNGKECTYIWNVKEVTMQTLRSIHLTTQIFLASHVLIWALSCSANPVQFGHFFETVKAKKLDSYNRKSVPSILILILRHILLPHCQKMCRSKLQEARKSLSL